MTIFSRSELQTLQSTLNFVVVQLQKGCTDTMGLLQNMDSVGSDIRLKAQNNPTDPIGQGFRDVLNALGGGQTSNTKQIAGRTLYLIQQALMGAHRQAPPVRPEQVHQAAPQMPETLGEVAHHAISQVERPAPPPPPPPPPPAAPQGWAPPPGWRRAPQGWTPSQGMPQAPQPPQPASQGGPSSYAWTLARRALSQDPSVLAELNQIETAANQGDRSAQILDGQIQNAARILNQSPGGVNPGNQTPFFSADPTLAGAPVWQVVGAASQEDYDALVSKIANAWNQGDPAAAPIIQMMTDAFSGGGAPVPIFLFAQDVYARAAQLAAPGTQADPLMAKVTSLINALGAPALAPAAENLPAFSADPIALNPTLLSHATALAQAVLAGHPLSPQIMQTLNQGVTESNPLLTALAHAVTGLGQGLGGMLPPAAPGLGSTPLGDAGTLLTTVENMAAQALDVTPLSQL